uniref:SIN3-HDAC complex associated factor n=1 Tax=Xenopus tropicalis TaxID=8364 RepID=A0A803JUI2_XENTR
MLLGQIHYRICLVLCLVPGNSIGFICLFPRGQSCLHYSVREDDWVLQAQDLPELPGLLHLQSQILQLPIHRQSALRGRLPELFWVVDARGGPNLKAMRVRPKKIRPFASRRLQNKQGAELKSSLYSGAHSTASSASPEHSSSCSNHSDTDTDTELRAAPSTHSGFSFLDPTYWKRQKVCCGIVYEGRYGELLIDAQLFKPCCSNKKPETQQTEPVDPQQLRPT